MIRPLLPDSEGRLRQLVEEFGRVFKRRKVEVNGSKSKVMKCTRLVDGRGMNVALNGEVLEEVECFKYLGSHVDKNRMNEVRKVCGRMKRVFTWHECKEKTVRGRSGTNGAIWG